MSDNPLPRRFVGKTIYDVSAVHDADEGVMLVFTDGSWLKMAWSGCQGCWRASDGQNHEWPEEDL